MTSYEHIKLHLATGTEAFSHSSIRHILPGISGGVARILVVSLTSPIELIRTIRTGGVSLSSYSIAKDLVANHGIAGLYRGWRSSILRDAPYSAIYWFVFERFRPIFSELFHNSDILTTRDAERNRTLLYSNTVNFMSGSSGGIIAAICTHPFDVLKTRQQLSACSAAIPATRSSAVLCSSSSSVITGLTQIFSEGGVGGLFRGLSLRIATVVPAGAILVTVYEAVKNL